MGVNTQQDDYYESLFRRTTASFRAKLDKENVNRRPERKNRPNEDNRPTTSKSVIQGRQRILQERNRQAEYSTTTTTDNSEARPSKSPTKQSQKEHGTKPTSLKDIVEGIVTQILQEKFSSSQDKNAHKEVFAEKQRCAYMDSENMKSVVQDLVNKILKDKLSGQRVFHEGPLKSTIEDIVNEKLKEQLSKLPQTSASGRNNDDVDILNIELQKKLNISKEKPHSPNSSKTLDSQALITELLSKDDPKCQSKQPSTARQRPPKGRCPTPEWEQLGDATNIIRLPRSQVKAPEWQEAGGKNKPRPTSVGRPRSPVTSTSGHSSRSHTARGNGVLIRRSDSRGRSRKPNNSDPVALYQYYKSEWDHFRKHIPGETNHNRLRWQVRQRLLDPE